MQVTRPFRMRTDTGEATEWPTGTQLGRTRWGSGSRLAHGRRKRRHTLKKGSGSSQMVRRKQIEVSKNNRNFQRCPTRLVRHVVTGTKRRCKKT